MTRHMTYKPNRPVDAQTSGLDKRFYGIFVSLIALSGLSVDWLNSLSLYELLSPTRACWAAILLYIVTKVRWNQWVTPAFPVALLVVWAGLHILNQLMLDGAASAVLTRIFQSSFIIALLVLTLQRGFELSHFCDAISPIIVIVSGIALVALLASSATNVDLFHMIRGSVIGVSSNFSIFCSQLFALFLLKDLLSRTSEKHSFLKTFMMLVLLTLPILGWQVVSSGRAGVVLTIISACGYGFARQRFKGMMIALVVVMATIVILDQAIRYFPHIFEVSRALLEQGIGVARQGDGIFRKLDLVFSLVGSTQHTQAIEAINRLSSWRIDGLMQTLEALRSDKFWFGFGVNNFEVATTTGKTYPHVELLRYFAELGVIGAFVAATIYAYPFVQTVISRDLLRHKVVHFSLAYMIGFLCTTLLQPSGPLTHLNNSWLFWILFCNLILLRERELSETTSKDG